MLLRRHRVAVEGDDLLYPASELSRVLQVVCLPVLRVDPLRIEEVGGAPPDAGPPHPTDQLTIHAYLPDRVLVGMPRELTDGHGGVRVGVRHGNSIELLFESCQGWGSLGPAPSPPRASPYP